MGENWRRSRNGAREADRISLVIGDVGQRPGPMRAPNEAHSTLGAYSMLLGLEQTSDSPCDWLRSSCAKAPRSFASVD